MARMARAHARRGTRTRRPRTARAHARRGRTHGEGARTANKFACSGPAATKPAVAGCGRLAGWNPPLSAHVNARLWFGVCEACLCGLEGRGMSVAVAGRMRFARALRWPSFALL